MTSPDTHIQPGSSPADPWRCPRCGTERVADDTFCGRCGTRRPVPEPATVTGKAASQPDRFPVGRALILNGVVLGAVLVAVVFGRDGGPVVIRFEPEVWRCDGTERAWTATIPARSTDLRVEWRLGGPEGELQASIETTHQVLEAFATGEGSFRVTSADRSAPECGLAPGTWTMAIRDASDNALLASGDVQLAAP